MGIEQQLFSAIDMLIDAKLKNMPLNTYFEAVISSETKNQDGSYNIVYQDIQMTAYPINKLQSFKKDEVVFVLLLGQNLSDKKIILSSKTEAINGGNINEEVIKNIINDNNRLKYGYNYLKNIELNKEYVLYGVDNGEEEEYIELELDVEKFLEDIKKANSIYLAFEEIVNLESILDGDYGLSLILEKE